MEQCSNDNITLIEQLLCCNLVLFNDCIGWQLVRHTFPVLKNGVWWFTQKHDTFTD